MSISFEEADLKNNICHKKLCFPKQKSFRKSYSSELANISNKLLSWGLSQELNSNEKDFFAASLPLVPSLQASETSAQWINIGFPRHLIGLSGKAEKVLSERVVFLKTDEHSRFQLKNWKILNL